MDSQRMPRAAHGFTLIELLVVLVIVGVVLTVAGLRMSGHSTYDQANTEARRLAALVKLAGEQAILNGTPVGMRIDTDGYRFLAQDQDKWTPSSDPLLRPRNFPSTVDARLDVEGGRNNTDMATDTPQVLLLPDGEMTAFKLELSDLQGRALINVTASATGDVQVNLPDQGQ